MLALVRESWRLDSDSAMAGAPPTPRAQWHMSVWRPTLPLERSQSDFFPFFRALVDGLEHPVHDDLVFRRFVRDVAANHGHEVRELGAIRLVERAFPRRGAAGRHVHRPAIQFLDHAQRREPTATTGREDLEPEAVLFAEVGPVH